MMITRAELPWKMALGGEGVMTTLTCLAHAHVMMTMMIAAVITMIVGAAAGLMTIERMMELALGTHDHVMITMRIAAVITMIAGAAVVPLIIERMTALALGTG